MLKIFAAIVLVLAGFAVFQFGVPALIAIGGIATGLAFSEGLDYAVRNSIGVYAGDEDDAPPRRGGGR